MANTQLISIGISFYNAEKYLAFAIQSVLCQTYPNWELILVDDGSTDKSLEIAHSFSDPRIKILFDGINKGLAFRLNELILLSNGTFFVRMDADDIMFPDRLEKQLNILKNNPKIDLVHSDAVSITNENIILGYKKSTAQKNKMDILNGSMPIHPTVMARIDFFKNNKYEEGFFQMEDLELWYRTIDTHVFFNLNEPCLFYREESTSIAKKHFRFLLGKQNFLKKYNFSFIKSFIFLTTTRIKGLFYAIFEKLEFQNILLARRYIKISPTRLQLYNTVLKGIIN